MWARMGNESPVRAISKSLHFPDSDDQASSKKSKLLLMARTGLSFPIRAHMNYPGMLGIYANRQFTKTTTETFIVTDSLAKGPLKLLVEAATFTSNLIKAAT